MAKVDVMVFREVENSGILEEVPLTLWELIDLLEKRRKGKHWESTDQRRTYEYATSIVKLSKEDSEQLLNILLNKFKIPRIVAVQLVNVLPVTVDELEPFLKQIEKIGGKLESEEREKFVRELLSVLREYWKKSKAVLEEKEEEEEST